MTSRSWARWSSRRWRANRGYLRGLYGVVKASDAHVHFTFLTGVSKFTKVSVFSVLNNLTDLTLKRRYSAICSYTERDLDTVFAPELFAHRRRAGRLGRWRRRDRAGARSVGSSRHRSCSRGAAPASRCPCRTSRRDVWLSGASQMPLRMWEAPPVRWTRNGMRIDSSQGDDFPNCPWLPIMSPWSEKKIT